MTAASLRTGSPAWRAGRAAAVLGPLIRGEAPADDLLSAVELLGAPPQGWWQVWAAARASGTVALLLPRPGDPRGLALPRGIAASGAVGWDESPGSAWLIPSGAADWTFHVRRDSPVPSPDPDDAGRALRSAVVAAAHVVDRLDFDLASREGSTRLEHERLVDSWVLGPPALPTSSRGLASLGLRMLLALDDARALVDTLALESAARSAVEAAYGTADSPR